MNQRSGNTLAAAAARLGFSGIHTSASPHAKRGGMIPIKVREVPLSTNCLFRMPASRLKRPTHVL